MPDASRLRVLHVVPATPLGGPPSFIRAQIHGLGEAGVDGQEFVFSGVTLLRTPTKLPRAFLELRRAIRSFRPSIVHAHWGSLLALAAVAASMGGPSVVITFRGSDLNPVQDENSVLRAVRTICSQTAAVLASAVICVSAELRGRLWRGSESARVIVDGTDLRLFRPMDREAARRGLGWSPRERVVLFNAGNRPFTKRLDLARAAVSHARTSIPELRLEVLNGDVPHERMPALLCAADCVLMTSDFEGSPNVVREALACRTPVVSVPVGDVERWLRGVAGTRVVPRHSTSIGDALVGILVDGIRPDVRDRVFEFSDEHSRDAILGVYEHALGRTRTVRPVVSDDFAASGASRLTKEAAE